MSTKNINGAAKNDVAKLEKFALDAEVLLASEMVAIKGGLDYSEACGSGCKKSCITGQVIVKPDPKTL